MAPHIDRIGDESIIFMDHYAQASCTAGRAAFITGQYPMRTGLSTVGLPGAKEGIQESDPTIAEMLKPLGYATGQFGKNHLGDRPFWRPKPLASPSQESMSLQVDNFSSMINSQAMAR
jgi:arylsulfatase A-like enzyme